MPIGAARVSWYCTALAAGEEDGSDEEGPSDEVGATWSK